jgi:hypothetical protein
MTGTHLEPMNNPRNMKCSIPEICRWLMFCLACSGLTFSVAQAETNTTFSARVVAVKGSVRYTTEGKDWEFLEAGDTLKAGALVQTAKSESNIELQLGELDSSNNATNSKPKPSSIRLYENSVFGIKKLSTKTTDGGPAEQIELELRSGEMSGVFRSMSQGSTYELEFPSGVVGSRGKLSGEETSYVLRASGGLAVISGRLVISMAGQQPQVVAAGHQFDPVTRQLSDLPAGPEKK